MANSLNGVVFPSPSLARQNPQQKLSSPVFLAPGNCNHPKYSVFSPNTSTAGRIQFPSPSNSSLDITSSLRYHTIDSYLMGSDLPISCNSPLTMSSSSSETVLDASSTSHGPSSWQKSVPTSLPWALPTQCGNNFVQFTASSSNDLMDGFLKKNPESSLSYYDTLTEVHVNIDKPVNKRKNSRKRQGRSINELNEGATNNKIFIHEDRMAAGMEGLQLQSTKTSSDSDNRNQENQSWFVEEALSSGEDSMGEDDIADMDTKGQTPQRRLQLSHELEMGLKNKELVPKLILDELNKSHMQIVLWQPPGGHVQDLITRSIHDGANQSGNLPGKMQHQQPTVSPPIWSIPVGKTIDEVDDTAPPDTNNFITSTSQQKASFHSNKFKVHSNTLKMDSSFTDLTCSSEQGSRAVVTPNFNFYTSGPSAQKSSGNISNGSSASNVRFDFNLGPSFWSLSSNMTETTDKVDFIACSTPNDAVNCTGTINPTRQLTSDITLQSGTEVIPPADSGGDAFQKIEIFHTLDDDMDL